jgi:hypothetical protein
MRDIFVSSRVLYIRVEHCVSPFTQSSIFAKRRESPKIMFEKALPTVIGIFVNATFVDAHDTR